MNTAHQTSFIYFSPNEVLGLAMDSEITGKKLDQLLPLPMYVLTKAEYL
jgi:hypothetical protein